MIARSDQHNTLIVPKRFDAHDIAPDDRFDAVAAELALFYSSDPVAQTQQHHDWAFSYWPVGNLVFCRHSLGPLRMRRALRHVKAALPDHLLIRCIHAGTQRQLHGNKTIDIGPGEVHLFDLGLTFDADQPMAMTSEAVFLPYAAVGYDPSRDPQHMQFSAHSPVGRIIPTALSTLLQQLPQTTEQDAQPLAQGFCGLVRGMIFENPVPSPAGQRADEAAAAAIRHHLDRHLTTQVDIARICRDFGISRANLYRIFETEGGVRRYVMSRRLDRALEDLALADPARGIVSTVAGRWGFADSYHFSRRFRERFGVSPSDAAGIGAAASHALATGPAAEARCVTIPDPFQRWLSAG